MATNVTARNHGMSPTMTTALFANTPALAGGVINTGSISPAASADGVVYSTANRFDATPTEVRAAVNSTGVIQTGTGITVGVMSDSFNVLGGAAQDEQDGALPTASNVDVLKDHSTGNDEGRAMLQIVHDIAPAAKLDFYTGAIGELQMAEGILALAAAGCRVICDDIIYFNDPMFQIGVVAQAIQTVAQEGVIYLTAAGNYASNGYQAAWNPIGSASVDGTALADVQNFGDGTPYETVTIGADPGAYVPVVIQWNQPFGESTSNLEALIFNNGTLFATATSTSATGAIQFGAEPDDPEILFTLPAGSTYQIAIENLSGPDPGLIGEMVDNDNFPSATLNVANAGTVLGHNAAPDAITVGAVDAGNAPANGGTLQNEPFSSSGLNTKLYFDNDGTTIAGAPLDLAPVAISGVDDIDTSVFSDFFGTSAATPSVAAVVALMLQANPALPFAEVKAELEDSAVSFGDPATAGTGLVNAQAAVLAAATTTGAAGHTGSAGYTNTGTTASLTINGGSFAGSISNSGKITHTGISVIDSTITGQVSNSGYLYGGIDLDASTHLTNSSGRAIAITGTTFFGNVSNGGTISAPLASGIAVDGTATFQGGINNAGSIAAAIGITVDPAATFTGFILNSPGGTLSATRTGIAIDEVASLFGGVENSGILIASIGVNIVDDGSFEGLINDNGGEITATTGFRIAGSTIVGSIYVNGTIDASRGILLDSASKITANNGSTATIDITAASFTGGIVNHGTIATAATNTADAVDVAGATSFAGGITNTGTVTGKDGIVLSSIATAAGDLVNSGKIVGAGPGRSGILLDQIATFAGSISNGPGGVITALNNAIGAFSVTQFQGNISNAGTLSALTGIYISTSRFVSSGGTGGITNTGTITGGNGIAIARSTLDAAIMDGGDIVAPSFGIDIDQFSTLAPGAGDGITITGSTFIGGLTNAGSISAPDTGLYVNGVFDFAGGITNSGAITATAGDGIAVGSVAMTSGATFGGGITNIGTVSGAIGIALTDAPGLTLFDAGTIVGTGGTAIKLDAHPDTLTLGPGYSITGTVAGGGSGTLQLGGSGRGTFNLAANGAQYNGFDTFAVTGGDWIVSSSGPAEWSVDRGATMTLAAGAAVTGTIVTSGALQVVDSGGTASGTAVENDGELEIFGGGTAPDFTVASGGVVEAGSGYTLANYSFSGGVLVEAGSKGTVSDATVSSGGTLFLLSHGTAIGTQVDSGGWDYVIAGGSDLGAQVSGVEFDFGYASGTVVSNGGVQGIFGSASRGVIDGGGYAVAEAGGTVVSETVDGTLGVVGSAVNTDVGNGGTVTVQGRTDATSVGNGGVDYVEPGGTESNTAIGNGGLDIVMSGGLASATAVSDGGFELIMSGGTGSGTVVDSGAWEYVLDGGTDLGAKVLGVQFVYGSASGTLVSSGGNLAVFGVASGVTIEGGAYGCVESGGTAVRATVDGTLGVVGDAVSATVDDGGVVSLLGTASGTIIGNGGVDYVNSGGSESGATISNGGIDCVLSGGFASDTTVSDGGIDFVMPGGSAGGTVVDSGGWQYVLSGGSGFDGQVSGAGVQFVYGFASGGTVSSGGVLGLFGSASDMTIETGGYGSVASGGAASNIMVDGSLGVVGSAVNTSIGYGGNVTIRGNASGTTIDAGGYEYVAAGGTERGATISGGGVLEVASGGSVAIAPVTFADSAGGVLVLDDSMNFGGLVAGFDGADLMAFTDIPYISGTTNWQWTQSGSSGTLMLSAGSDVANINLLGQYSQSSFALAAYGGGTLVSNSPLITSGGMLATAQA